MWGGFPVHRILTPNKGVGSFVEQFSGRAVAVPEMCCEAWGPPFIGII